MESVPAPLPAHRECLELNVKILQNTGFWPRQDGRTGCGYRFGYLYPRVVVTMATTVLFGLVTDALSGVGKMSDVSENIYVSFVIFTAILKGGTLFFRMNKIVNLVEKFRNIKKSRDFEDKKQLEIYNQYQRYSRLITKGFLMLIAMTATNYVTEPLIKKLEDFPLPHRMYFPYDYTVKPYYHLSYLWLSAATFGDAFVIGFCDVLFLSMIINAIMQFKLLQYKLEHVREIALKKVLEKEADFGQSTRRGGLRRLEGASERVRVDETLSNRIVNRNRVVTNSSWAKIRNIRKQRESKNKSLQLPKRRITSAEIKLQMDKFIADVVEHHQNILSAVQDLESIFDIVLMAQFLASLIFLCMAAFTLTKSDHIDAKFISLLQLIASSLTELILFCWFSTTLADESTKLNEALINCDWIESSPEFKRSIQIILLGSMKPVHIRAGGFVPVSLELFREVLKTSYSFYTLLAQLDTSSHHHKMAA